MESIYINNVGLSKKILKIAIATTGRFHVLDLARELSKLGHEVKFYSYVPKKRAIRFGLPEKCHVGLLQVLFPLVILHRLLGQWAEPHISRWIRRSADWLVCRRLQPCDVFIGMSGIYLSAPKFAKRKFGATVFVERGSRHILSQSDILKSLFGDDLPSDYTKRELASYGIADKVVIPSNHVRESFLEYGFPGDRLFVNPYGVDTNVFIPCNKKSASEEPVAIFVGTWCQRKGADLVIQAIKMINGLSLMHVGAIGDVSFPVSPAFIHCDAVDQMQLPLWYRRATIFVLPSREEGLSLVQAQALGCGLPVVCTERTGGADLKPMIDCPEAIVQVPTDDVEALAHGIRKALDIARNLKGKDLLGVRGRQSLTWAAYGKRYENELFKIKIG
jgi:glycosyltransferase involved in cell wall biosynthesis